MSTITELFNQLFLFGTGAWFLASLLLIPAALLIVLKKQWQFNWLIFALLVFQVLYAVSLLFADQPVSYTDTIAFMVGPVIVMLASQYRDWISKNKFTDWLGWLFVILTTVISLIGILAFIPEAHSRLSSIFVGIEPYTAYPNTLALFLLLWLPFVYQKTVQKIVDTKVVAGLFLAVVTIINTTALALTFSRAAYLAAGVAIIFSLIIYLVKDKQKNLLTVVTVVFLLGLSIISSQLVNNWHEQAQPAELAAQIPLTESINERFSPGSISSSQSSSERIQFWRGSLKLIKGQPIFGYGPASFTDQYPKVQTELLASAPHPHNLFLKVAVDAGLPAALLLSAILVAVLIFAIWKAPNWATASLVGAAVMLQLDYNLDAMIVWLSFWLVIGIQVASLPTHKIDWQRRPINNLILKLALALMCLTIVALSLIHIGNYSHLKEAEQLVDNNPTQAIEILAAADHSPFLNLRYDLLAELASNHDIPDEILPMPANWPTAQILYARDQKPLAQKFAYYQQALNLDPLNNLEWHREFLRFLTNEQLAELAPYYQTLLSDYAAKLNVNAHHTVASQNPEAAIKIAQLFQLRFPQELTWPTLADQLQVIYDRELEKFNLLIPHL